MAFVPTAAYMLAEFIGGILAYSLALISDAAHMATDVVGLGIAIAAIRIGRRPADRQRTYGYERFEILAAAFNSVLLFGVAAYIVYEAYRRLVEPPQIATGVMLGIALLGLAVNAYSMWILSERKEGSLNVQGAYLEVWSDFIGSLGVIGAAVLIRLTGWLWVDSLVAVLIGLWVLPRTWRLLTQSVNILLEGVPENINAQEVLERLRGIPGVSDVHDLHIWALTSGQVCLTAHMVAAGVGQDGQALLAAARRMLREKFNISHVTIQWELVPCEDAQAGHRFL